MTKPTTSTAATAPVDKLLYTPVEAAHALGVSRSTVYELIATGVLPSVQIGSCRRVPVDGLRSYVRTLAAKASRRSPVTHRSLDAQAPLWS